jgi:hypothetical protein
VSSAWLFDWQSEFPWPRNSLDKMLVAVGER